MQLEVSSCLGYCPKNFNVQGYDTQAKTNVFFQLTLLSNNLVLMSYLEWYLFRIVVFLIIGKSAGNIENKKRKQTEEKH